MKNFLKILPVLACLLLGAVACNNVKPEFKYSLELSGDVSNAPTAIAGDFSVNVLNDQVNVFQLNDASLLYSIEAPEGVEAEAWLDSYIQSNVLNNFNDATVYDIYVKGYVKEVNTGLLFSVDKRFTNKDL